MADDETPMDPDPFADLLGMRIVEMEDGYARGVLPMRPALSSSPDTTVAHGGVPYALADHTGGAAAVSVDGWPTPTIDMRIDYLRPVTDDLEAVAEIARMGKNVATVDVELSTGSDGTVAVGRGVYKVGGREESAWSGE
ncbi:PaaI family thioesterase [Natronomonas marina]|jgi:uncharacterized protein (TIGR00369 family)|uniref:PaaI family thioesterase n=1 Tax=Natronomonas marina TaxID=2961939 RepID=UPI0020CA22C6|nr:PaaI family thioesterase [Natronomonas marina]